MTLGLEAADMSSSFKTSKLTYNNNDMKNKVPKLYYSFDNS